MDDTEKQNGDIYFHKPSLVLRIKSSMIDTITLIVLLFISFAVLNQFNIESILVKRICMLLIILYEPITVSVGGTIGQRIMGIRVSSFSTYLTEKSHKNINILNSIIRYIGKLFLGWLSLLTIHSSNYGQAIHDKLGRSIMTFRV